MKYGEPHHIEKLVHYAGYGTGYEKKGLLDNIIEKNK
jgi:hypothetical protein